MRLSEAKRDHYRKLARKQGFRSRAAYKLLQLNKKYNFLVEGYRVLDLGASPGGWSQAASDAIGEKGFVMAVDLRPVTVNRRNIGAIKGNVFDDKTLLDIGDGFDVVLSDMAPHMTGVWEHDQMRQENLARRASEIALRTLKPGGSFICKVFDGEGIVEIVRDLRKGFDFVNMTKPKASRRESSELYIVCKGRHSN
ncbi:MAG: RlmE family RNA methyltransferase [Nitrososphaerota archaeon]|nr:RlmE family RNA methyltransferase [Nitrososphaerota archaeon]MDG7049167.1 RlmE family RNA methyltransferase [Nitrososphaerota archaeon]MDG7050861.1 RlmE family RNA methyltransferase [Nitrososphaerota archaeon]